MNTKSVKMIACSLVLLVMPSFLFCATADDTATYVGSWAELYVAAMQGKTNIVITEDITYGEADETVVFTNAITLQSTEGEQFTLDGNGKQILCIQGEDKSTAVEGESVIKNLIFINGDASNITADIYKRGYGGALFVKGSLHVENCEFDNNQANVGGALAVMGTLVLTDCAIKDNMITAQGGGVYVSGGDVTITNCQISGNTAGDGGGLYIQDGNLLFVSGEITGNSAEAARGGGISVVRGSVTMSGGEIIGNISPAGGGISVSDGEVFMSGGVISENTAMLGGGIYVSTGESVTITGGEIYKNNATAHGGGVHARDGVITDTSNCIFDNTPENTYQ